jgi:hypothetical protein
MITLAVTQDDIAYGRARNSRLCPIARSAWRVFQAGDTVSVGCDHVYVTTPARMNYVYKMDANARDWQHEYDNGMPVEPTTVKLELIDTWEAS